jgi:hypothetical protein
VELKDFQIIRSRSYKGTCGAERPFRPPQQSLDCPSRKVEGGEKTLPKQHLWRRKTFRLSTASPTREPVELKDLQTSTAFPGVILRGGLKEEK